MAALRRLNAASTVTLTPATRVSACLSSLRTLWLCWVGLSASACSVLDPTGEWRGKPVAAASVSGLAQAPTVPAPPAPLPAPLPPPPSAPASAAPSQALAAMRPPGPVPDGSSPAGGLVALDERAVSALFDLAERAYRSGSSETASRLFEQLSRLRPGRASVWLRIGNLSHRERDFDAAARAYRRAADLAGGRGEGEADIRSKALANLAIVAVERARLALDDWQGQGAPTAASAYTDQVEAALESIVRGVSASPGRPVPDRTSFIASSSSSSTASADAAFNAAAGAPTDRPSGSPGLQASADGRASSPLRLDPSRAWGVEATRASEGARVDSATGASYGQTEVSSGPRSLPLPRPAVEMQGGVELIRGQPH